MFERLNKTSVFSAKTRQQVPFKHPVMAAKKPNQDQTTSEHVKMLLELTHYQHQLLISSSQKIEPDSTLCIMPNVKRQGTLPRTSNFNQSQKVVKQRRVVVDDGKEQMAEILNTKLGQLAAQAKKQDQEIKSIVQELFLMRQYQQKRLPSANGTSGAYRPRQKGIVKNTMTNNDRSCLLIPKM